MTGLSLDGRCAPLLNHSIAKIVAVMVCLTTASDILLASLGTISHLAGMVRENLPLLTGIVYFLTRGEIPDIALSIIGNVILIGAVASAFIAIGKPGWIHIFSIVICTILLLFTLLNVILMVASLWNPNGQADLLFKDAVMVWVFNIFLSGAFFWLLDSPRQKRYHHDSTIRRDCVFPQNLINDPAWKDWTPSLLEYLYLSFSISVTLGPSDILILTERGKVLVVVETVVSLILIVTIVARAINII